jgi:DNA-binding SARP family transcriptional activator
MLTINTLGGLSIQRDDDPITDFRSVKIEAMLAYLAYHQGEAISRDALMHLLWPEKDPSRAQANLRKSLSRMKKTLQPGKNDPEYALIDRNNAQLNAGITRVDVRLYEAQLKACPQHGHNHDPQCDTCIQNVTQALTLYNGAFLDNFYVDDSQVFEDWLVMTRENLEQQAVRGLRLLADYHESRADYSEALRYARRLIQMDSLSEQAHRQYMRLLARRGERSAALAHYRDMRQMLLNELTIEPAPDTERLVERIRRISETRPHNLLRSPGKTVVGRDDERAYIRQNLADRDKRLLTLAGIGGAGKTTLALEVGWSVVDDYYGPFMDGVCLINLSAVDNESSQVSSSVLIDTLAQFFSLPFLSGQSAERELIRHLRQKECLLIIDNAEVLDDDSRRLIHMLLQQTDGVQFLVTSRTRLNIMGEWILEVSGLSFPDVSQVPEVITELDRLDTMIDRYDALQLFEERAQQMQPDFQWATLSDDDRRALIRISQMTEGLCLALELAATWVGKLSCSQIAAEIEASLDILDVTRHDLPLRHRGIRAVFNYSQTLLSDDEKNLLNQLAVFPGSFDSEAAQQITGATLRQLSDLIDKSLLSSFERGDVMRYRLHPLLRQFLLENQTDSAALRLRHAAYYAELIQSQDEAAGMQSVESLRVFERDLDNLLAGWHWLIQHPDVSLLLPYVDALHSYFMLRSLNTQGESYFQAAASALRPDNTMTDASDTVEQEHLLLYCRIVSRLASFQHAAGDSSGAEQSIQQAQKYVRLVESGEEIVHIHSKMGEIAKAYGQYERAQELFQFALDVTGDTGDTFHKGRLLMLLGATERDRGQLDPALDYFRQSLAVYRELNLDWGTAHSLRLIGGVLLQQQQLNEAESHFQQALTRFNASSDIVGAALVHRELGKLACERAIWSTAETHFSQALDLVGETSDVKGSALVYQDIGRYHLHRQHHERAQDYLLSSFQIATHIRDIPLVLDSLLDLIELVVRSETDPTTRPDTLPTLISFVYVRSENQPQVRNRAKELLQTHFPDESLTRSEDVVFTLNDLRDQVEREFQPL